MSQNKQTKFMDFKSDGMIYSVHLKQARLIWYSVKVMMIREWYNL